jgi:hypothetical protein
MQNASVWVAATHRAGPMARGWLSGDGAGRLSAGAASD